MAKKPIATTAIQAAVDLLEHFGCSFEVTHAESGYRRKHFALVAPPKRFLLNLLRKKLNR